MKGIPMKGSLKRLLALLIALLAILLGVASLFSRFSWGIMALSLGLALVQFLFSRAARRVSQA
jgi:cell shape-determining protein MreC